MKKHESIPLQHQPSAETDVDRLATTNMQQLYW